MNARRRIAAVYAAVTAALLSLWVAVPAYASHGDEDKIDTLEPFRHIGEPQNWVAIAIVMVVLLVIVFALSGWVSSLFKKN